MIMNLKSTCLVGVHRVVVKSDKIHLDLYCLEVFASNGHSQVSSWTFLMVVLALNLLMIMNPMNNCLKIVHGCGVHRVVFMSDKIPLDLYYLEVFASNGHSKVNSWTFAMVLLALDPPYDYEFNEHLFVNCSWVCTEMCCKVTNYYQEDFASNCNSQVNSLTFVMVLLALDTPNDYEFNEHLFGSCPWLCTELC